MKRSQFLKNLIALGGLSFLSGKTFQTKQFQKYYLLQSFVRGFRFYEGPKLLDEMKKGDLLELVREQENKHDNCAIALHWNKNKIGYIPAESNELLSRLLDIGIPDLVAEITFLEPGAAAWENVNIAVYVLKELPAAEPIPAGTVYLTQLDTPHYRTLNRNDNKLTKVYYEEEQDEDYEVKNYYAYLVDNSKDDSIYGYIHSDLDAGADYEKQIDFLAVNKKKIENKPALLQRLKQMESELYNAEQMFNEDGYIVLSVNKAEGLIKEISGLGDIADKLGRKFIELKF